MNLDYIGFLHPGAMGISLAASAQNSGYTACWASEGRRKQSINRANEHNLKDLLTVQAICDNCAVIISICPPHAAKDVAEQVIACDFTGIYVDANAISPQTSLEIGDLLSEAGIDYVDGGVIGGPAWQRGTTWLYLSGKSTEAVAAYFSEGPLETELMGNEIGKASALKMCFGANTKGATALLCAITAAAESLGVREHLEEQWNRYTPGSAEKNTQRISRVTAKAWRFSGEMSEIARTLQAAGLPDGFHLAAEETYRRMAEFKDAEDYPAIEDVLNKLINPD